MKTNGKKGKWFAILACLALVVIMLPGSGFAAKRTVIKLRLAAGHCGQHQQHKCAHYRSYCCLGHRDHLLAVTFSLGHTVLHRLGPFGLRLVLHAVLSIFGALGQKRVDDREVALPADAPAGEVVQLDQLAFVFNRDAGIVLQHDQ